MQKTSLHHTPVSEPKTFLLLVLINFFVGGMIGLERTILPLLAEQDFGIASNTAAIAFIATFGLSKAILNFFAGRLADRWGRRRVLLIGWLTGIPVPVILLLAPAWSWVIAANILLGINQACTWSMTLNMKIDLVGPQRGGMAAGWNEFAGYAGVAVVALLSGLIASTYALRPEPFYLGIGVALSGTLLSLGVAETNRNVQERITVDNKTFPSTRATDVVHRSDHGLRAASFAGLLINMKDGMLWGLLPLYLTERGLELSEIALVVGAYPAVWGISQLVFGPISDRWGRITVGVGGMVSQGIGVVGFVLFESFEMFVVAAFVVGVGTAMTYPTLLAFVADISEEERRASAVGVYRFWRDLGYVIGALGVGLLSDLVGIAMAFLVAALLLSLGAVILKVRTTEMCFS